jgi:hypothetical protein
VAAFTDLNWLRIDVWTIVFGRGLATVDERRHSACREWLVSHDYTIDTWDCRPGLALAMPELGRMLRWQEQFGYSLKSGSRNLDALNDGFDFKLVRDRGRVFEIIRPDVAWQEDSRWLLGLLSIASEQSLTQLALGNRFLTLLVVPEGSPFIGTEIETLTVPRPLWNPNGNKAEIGEGGA